MVNGRSWLGPVLMVLIGGACGEEGPFEAPPESTTAALAATAQSYLVSFAGGVIPAGAAATVTAAGGTVVASYNHVGVVLARSSRSSFAATLRAATGIDAVGSARAVKSALTPVTGSSPARRRPAPLPPVPPVLGDSLSFRQWNMDQIHAPQAQVLARGKPSTLVAVFDSGIDVTHPDLAAQVDPAASVSCVGGVPNAAASAWANDVIGHGTHVSGIIAAARNGVGVVGVAPGVRLAAAKIAVDDVNDPNFGLVFADAIVCAIDWAIAHGVDLINASLTIDPFTAPFDSLFCTDQPDRTAIVAIVRHAVGEAARRKIPLIAAAGNFFTDLANLEGSTPGSDCQVLPVQLPRVIGVSAVGYTRRLSFYSNYGLRAIDLTAPGGDGLVPNPVAGGAAAGQVLSSIPPNSLFYQAAADWDGQVQDCSSGTCSTYAYLQGTSQAAPHVTGVAALAVSRLGRLSPEALLAVLGLTATPLACPQGPYDPGMTGTPAACRGIAHYNSFYGAGEVDALAVARLLH